jgi:hypothetical protein
MISIDKITHISTITATFDFYGLDIPVTFTATDDSSASVTETTTISVLSVNDAHSILSLPELAFNEDDTLIYPIENWFPFIVDADGTVGALSYVVMSGVIVMGEAILDAGYRFHAPSNWFGRDTLQLVVSDTIFADTTHFYVTVNSVNDPPVISGLPESVAFETDSSAVLNMWEYVEDVETPDSLLSYEFDPGNDSLHHEIDRATGNLTLSAQSGFIGESVLNITVTDDSNAVAEGILRVIVSPIAGINDPFAEIVTEYVLMQNYPNPFNPTTQISFGLPVESNVKIEVFNILGQRVEILLDETVSPGYHSVDFDASKLASGVFFYRMHAGQFKALKKLLLMR